MYREFRNTLIYGEPGTGKSRFLRFYIEEIIDDKTDDSEIYLISHKQLGYSSPKIKMQVANNFEENIKEIYKLFKERLEKSFVRSLPKIYFFLDGLTKTFRIISDDAKAMLGEMMESGPKANLFCIMTSSTRDFDAHILSGSTIIELK